jgi:protein-S-isoprenylcysteine O-methyltransferase Ste14
MPPDNLPHAGVHVPPPFIYVAGIAAGYLLHLWRPLAITGNDSNVRLLAAILFVLGYLILFFSALAAFRRAQTTLIPNRPATRIVTGGPYRLTRNPMYVSLVLLYVGVALFMNSWWQLILLPVVVIIVDRFVIAREERYLASAFPAEYGALRSRVRRWL